MVEPARALAAVRRAATLNPLFALDTGPPDEAHWRPASDLAEPDAARRLIGDVGHGFDDPPARIAASMTVLGYSARLVAPTVAALLCDGILLEVTPGNLWWRYAPGSGFQLRLPAPSGSRDASLDRWCSEVVDEHLGRLIRTVREIVAGQWTPERPIRTAEFPPAELLSLLPAAGRRDLRGLPVERSIKMCAQGLADHAARQAAR
jgi:hypothetical protein